MVTMLKNKCSVWKRIKFPTFWYNSYYFTWSDTYFIQLETLLINHPSYIVQDSIGRTRRTSPRFDAKRFGRSLSRWELANTSKCRVIQYVWSSNENNTKILNIFVADFNRMEWHCFWFYQWQHFAVERRQQKMGLSSWCRRSSQQSIRRRNHNETQFCIRAAQRRQT